MNTNAVTHFFQVTAFFYALSGKFFKFNKKTP